MIRSFEALERVRQALPAPRSAVTLVEDVAILGIGADDIVVDVGAWGGLWSQRLSVRYACHCIALDLSHVGLSETAGRSVPGVRGDAAVLPLRSGSVDAVWCRDTMSMLDSPRAVLGEFVRVVGPGGGVMLYTAYPTGLLEQAEKAWFLAALEAPSWWGEGRGGHRPGRPRRRLGGRGLRGDLTRIQRDQAARRRHRGGRRACSLASPSCDDTVRPCRRC